MAVPRALESCPCTDADHDRVRSNVITFLDETTPIGVQPDGGNGVLLANCKRCNSTISREMPARPRSEREDRAREMSAAAQKLAIQLGLCPICGDDTRDGRCAACERVIRGERCCEYGREREERVEGAVIVDCHTHGINAVSA